MNWKAERKRIRKIANRWYRPLGLDEWRLTTRYTQGNLIVDGAVSSAAVGMASVRWQYREAELDFNLEKTAKLSDEDLEEVYIHEVMHVLLNEMREEGIEHEERTAQTLMFAFMRLRGALK